MNKKYEFHNTYVSYNARVYQKLYEYCFNKMTKQQLKQAYKLLDDKIRLLYYVCYSYNCYELLHNKETFSLITNPEALWTGNENPEQFIKDITGLIKDTIFNERGVLIGRNTNNTTNQSNTKN